MKRRSCLQVLPVSILALPFTGVSYGASSSIRVSPAPGLPDPSYIKTNGVTMGCYDAGNGMPVVFCHGFPELAFSWRYQFHAVTEAGFRAIAPDLRGYGLTEAPADLAAYTTATICDDLAGMLDSLEIEKAVFCGHDWGGFVVDTMAVLYPERCLGIIGVGAHNNLRPPDLPYPELPNNEILDKPAFNQFIQLPETQAFLDTHVRELFSLLFRKDYFTADHVAALPQDAAERSIDLVAMIETYRPGQEVFVTDEALDYYTKTFEATGFGGGINWYKAIPATIAEIDSRSPQWRVEAPYLYIWPEQDPINRDGLEMGMEDYITDLEKVELTGAGHFAQEDSAAQLSHHIVDWLQRKFPTDMGG